MKVPTERAKRSYYDLEWASGVAEAHKGKYPRATEILLEFYQVDTRFPARLLAFRASLWENWKKQVTLVDGWIGRCPAWHDFCKDREAILVGLEHFLQANECWDLREDLDTSRSLRKKEAARSVDGCLSDHRSEGSQLQLSWGEKGG